MALDDLRIVILPRKQVLTIGPGREAPDGRKPAAVDPYRRVIRCAPRGWEECWNDLVESLSRAWICLADIDAIGRVGELEIVHGAGADDLAQLGYGNLSWLAP